MSQTVMEDTQSALATLTPGTRVMAWLYGVMHPATVVEPIPGEGAGHGYISVRFKHPIPDRTPGSFTTHLTINQPASIRIGWTKG
jgi:hypothetical protein